jgi:glycine/D-amino acid oxidase-like deaminating enzyme
MARSYGAGNREVDARFDAVVIGGGFYGCSIALVLKRDFGLDRVCLVEREHALMSRASYVNQARLHNGYHYPRSLTTACRSRVNFPRFVADFGDCVVDEVDSLYCIARRNSKVSARQFAKFCQLIGAEVRPAPEEIAALFSDRLIETVLLVREHAFDARRLRTRMERDLAESVVERRLDTAVEEVELDHGEEMEVSLSGPGGHQNIACRWLFNCAYAGLGSIDGLGQTGALLKFEITEMTLVEMPDEAAGLAVTVMDGPFFSAVPFPHRALHTLSHVRYTPHFSWTSADANGTNPYAVLAAYGKASRAGRMIRDAARYMPCLASVDPVESLFEVKTVLVSNEADDGRPILFEQHPRAPRCFSVLGGKIDNVYDVCDVLRSLPIHG